MKIRSGRESASVLRAPGLPQYGPYDVICRALRGRWMGMPSGLTLPCACPTSAADGHLWALLRSGCDGLARGVDCSSGHPVTVRLGYRSMPPIWCESANTGKCICESVMGRLCKAEQGYAASLEGGNIGRGVGACVGIRAWARRALRAADGLARGLVVMRKSAQAIENMRYLLARRARVCIIKSRASARNETAGAARQRQPRPNPRQWSDPCPRLPNPIP